ncbi:MAG: phosphoribosylanthranilate isomerase [Spartobacteria bacterium]
MDDFEPKVAVKICGLTSVADALACADAGADWMGLNFSPRSVRCLTPALGAEIIAAVRPRFPRIKFAGVFVDQGRELVRQIATDLALDAVQLHGNETVEDVDATRGFMIIKALRVGAELPDVGTFAAHCDAILLDTWSASAPGGTGETFPWEMAAALRPQIKRLILAGGLTSENVSEAIRAVRPFAVDVCSGVERGPGKKDERKMRNFIAAVRAAERGGTRP